MGPSGRCRYFTFFFFVAIYSGFAISYFLLCVPNLPLICPESYSFHVLLSVFVLPLPWIVVAICHFIDPGEVTARNVESYIEKYPYDNVLYKRQICRTLLVPAPARSRYCQYTKKRVAYFFFSNRQKI
jgi:hypothetical protein